VGKEESLSAWGRVERGGKKNKGGERLTLGIKKLRKFNPMEGRDRRTKGLKKTKKRLTEGRSGEENIF